MVLCRYRHASTVGIALDFDAVYSAYDVHNSPTISEPSSIGECLENTSSSALSIDTASFVLGDDCNADFLKTIHGARCRLQTLPEEGLWGSMFKFLQRVTFDSTRPSMLVTFLKQACFLSAPPASRALASRIERVFARLIHESYFREAITILSIPYPFISTAFLVELLYSFTDRTSTARALTLPRATRADRASLAHHAFYEVLHRRGSCCAQHIHTPHNHPSIPHTATSFIHSSPPPRLSPHRTLCRLVWLCCRNGAFDCATSFLLAADAFDQHLAARAGAGAVPRFAQFIANYQAPVYGTTPLHILASYRAPATAVASSSTSSSSSAAASSVAPSPPASSTACPPPSPPSIARSLQHTLRTLLGVGAKLDIHRSIDRSTPLDVAVTQGNVEFVWAALSCLPPTDWPQLDRYTFLTAARKSGCGMMSLLHAVYPALFTSRASVGVLVEALRGNQLDVLRFLLSCVDVSTINARCDEGDTALTWAASTEQTDAAVLLLAAGADVNITASSGATALMRACYTRCAPMVALLVGAGADVNASSHSHSTSALSRAAVFGRVESIEVLLSAGATVDTDVYRTLRVCDAVAVMMEARLAQHKDVSRLEVAGAMVHQAAVASGVRCCDHVAADGGRGAGAGAGEGGGGGGAAEGGGDGEHVAADGVFAGDRVDG